MEASVRATGSSVSPDLLSSDLHFVKTRDDVHEKGSLAVTKRNHPLVSGVNLITQLQKEQLRPHELEWPEC